MMYAKIQPVTCVPSVATKLFCANILVRNLGINNQAQINWYLSSDNNINLQSGYLIMPAEDYNQWGIDDTYILTYLAQKLNLVIVEIVQNNNTDKETV